MKLPVILASVLALAWSASAFNPAYAKDTDSRKDIKMAKDNPTIRGGIVYKHYCALCHGHRGDGKARATKLYGQGNLVIAMQNDRDYYEKMLREGGEGVGLSKYMPAWGDELTDQQISDVLDYLELLDDDVERGRVVFMTNCILCHGVKANGKGRASVMYDPPPADLTHSDKTDLYKKLIITNGGKYMGRSPVMPVWGLQLKDEEIDDVIAYLRTILVVPWPGE